MKTIFWNSNFDIKNGGRSKSLDNFALENKYQLVKTSSGFVENDWGVYFPLGEKATYEIGMNHKSLSYCKIFNAPEIVIQRNGVNEFLSNPHSKDIVDEIDPDRVIVYGEDIEETVRGFRTNGKEVYVVEDAVKEISGGDLEN